MRLNQSWLEPPRERAIHQTRALTTYQLTANEEATAIDTHTSRMHPVFLPRSQRRSLPPARPISCSAQVENLLNPKGQTQFNVIPFC